MQVRFLPLLSENSLHLPSPSLISSISSLPGSTVIPETGEEDVEIEEDGDEDE